MHDEASNLQKTCNSFKFHPLRVAFLEEAYSLSHLSWKAFKISSSAYLYGIYEVREAWDLYKWTSILRKIIMRRLGSYLPLGCMTRPPASWKQVALVIASILRVAFLEKACCQSHFSAIKTRRWTAHPTLTVLIRWEGFGHHNWPLKVTKRLYLSELVLGRDRTNFNHNGGESSKWPCGSLLHSLGF